MLEEVFRQEWGRLVATIIRLVGDFDLAEEIVQDALATAAERWPVDGTPRRPGAWLMTTARNRALDHLRREKRASEKRALVLDEERDRAAHAAGSRAEEAMRLARAEDPGAIPDDRLRLIFVCCHPVLSREAQVSLTLRLLGGLTTREIARAFLAPEPTVAQRIVRAKKTIAERRLPYRVPDAAQLPERLPAVLDVLYLVFNEGYAARDGDDLVRLELCDEALRMAALLAELLPGQTEILGLLALMEFQASRQATRTDAQGELVLLEDQDRSRWDRLRIERARRHLERAVGLGAIGPYGLQAAIAECHATAPSWDATDWARIAELYDVLVRVTESPVVELNRAVAVAMRDGPEAGLRLLDVLDESPRMASYHLLPATRADLLRQLDRLDEAALEYARARGLATNARERAFLERRLVECESTRAERAGRDR